MYRLLAAAGFELRMQLAALDTHGPALPARFDKDTFDKVKELAAADDRSVSSWIRRAVA